jgi:CubicO group peptidase (beta-lactamase class C family)
MVPGSSRALGWDTPSEGGSAGTRLSRSSFGHTGFTGTSLWIDPEHHLAIVLLSNRVNPTRANSRWTSVRGAIADLVMTTLFQDTR